MEYPKVDNQPHVGTCQSVAHPPYKPHRCHEECVDWIPLPQPTPAEPRTMRLPKNAAHPNFNEFHKEDDWCARAGCTVVCDSWPPAGKMETPAEPRIETLSTFSVPMADVIRVIEALTGPTGGWLDSPRVVLGKIREHAELWRARAGAQPEPEERAEFEKFWGRVEFDDWPIDWKKAKKIWDAAQQSLKDAPTEEETVWVIEHSAHGGEWRPVGCIFYNSPNAENDARRQLAYLNNNGHKDFAVRVSRYERSNGRARAGAKK